MEKVRVYSSQANIGIYLPHTRFKRMWTKKNAFHDITEDDMTEIMADAGCEAMFRKGLLYIKEEDKVEEFNAKPVGKIYNEAQLKALLTAKTAKDLSEAIKGMAPASVEELIELGKVNEVSTEKIIVIKELTGTDLTAAQNLYRQELTNPVKPPKED